MTARALVGADPDNLRATATRFEQAATELQALQRQVQGAIGAASWRGPRAET